MQDPVKEIKEKLDIVDIIKGYIPIQQAGNSYKALCPFHKEKTPSFVISPERQSWHCFGQCNEGGDLISFVMKYENVEFYDALKILAEKAGVELRKISPSTQREFGVLYDINNSAEDFFVKQMNNSEEAKRYFSSRGLKKETIDEFKIGFAPPDKDMLTLYLIKNGYDINDIERAGLAIKTKSGIYMDRFRGRIMFPLYNTFGKVVAFAGRILPKYDNGKVGKYINSPETLIYHKSKILYGFNFTKKFIKDTSEAILVEGNMDIIMLWQDGVRNVVAISGTALTQAHLDIIGRLAKKIILAFDNDDAGKIATERAIDMANNSDFSVSVLSIHDVKDMADFVYNNPGKSKKYINDNKVRAEDFYMDNNIPKIKLSGGYVDKEIINRVLKKIVKLNSPIEKNKWIKKLSERTDVPESTLLDSLDLIERKDKDKIDKMKYVKKDEVSLSRLNALSFNLLPLIIIDKSILDSLGEYSIYLPKKFLNIIKKIELGGDDFKNDKTIEKIEMQSVLLNLTKESAREKAMSVFVEIKKEYLKNKRNELHKKIAEAEKSGDLDKANSLLAEFYEIAKLINT